jgi:uncharacterized protein YkwD
MKFVLILITTIFLNLFVGNAQIVVIQGNGNSTQSWQDHYDQAPNVGSCFEGVLKDSEKQEILNYVNLIRSLHNLVPVTYDYTGDSYAQKASLIQVANSFLSHTPPTSASCYSDDGYYGSENSNLFLYQMPGGSSDVDSKDAVTGWMWDNNSANAQDRCGHRRAIINPFVTEISFGRVDGQSNVANSWGIGMALKYMDHVDGDISTRPIDYVAYPYQSYPIELVDKSWYLSFSPFYDMTGWYKNTNVDYTNVQISVTKEDGTPLNVNSIIYDFEGWGAVQNNLRWKVDGLQDEVKYIVDIKNIVVNGQNKEYNYWFKLTDNIYNQKPNTPLLSYPQDNAQNVPLNVSFSWSVVNYAYSYKFQLATDFNFQNIVKDTTVVSNGMIIQGLTPLTQYFWRVRAINDIGQSDWAQTFTYTTAAPKPDKPNLVYPTNNLQDVSIIPTFKWNNIAGAQTYQIQVAYKNDFSGFSVIIDKSGLTDTTFTPDAGQLNNSMTYYWRVASYANGQKSTYSNVWSFKTKAQVIPDPPNLSYPANNAVDVELTPLLKWDDMPNATTYKVQVATNYNFAQDNIVINQTVNQNSYQVKSSELQPNIKYYWRVQSIGESGFSDWSLIRIFTTTSGQSVNTKIEDGTIQIIPNPTSDFVSIKVNKDIVSNATIQIYDLFGKLIHSSLVNSQTNSEFDLNLSKLPVGIYYFRIQSNGDIYTGKIEKI